MYEGNKLLQEKILSGVEKLSNIVSSTLGPGGRNVILQQKERRPIITKDGVTVARFVDFDDPFENVGAQILKQAALQTANEAGDGTTTSTLLAYRMLCEAQKYLSSGVSPTEMKRGMDLACEDAIKFIVENSKDITSLADIENIATISSNNDAVIGKLITKAVDLAGKNGAITIDDSKSYETELDLTEGFIFESGFLSSRFITDEMRKVAKHNDCLLFITDWKLEYVEPILPVLELAAREKKPLIIVTDDIEGQLLASLIMNTIKNSMKVVAVKAPYYGEERRNVLSDLAIATGGKFFTRESGEDFSQFTLSDFGRCKSVEIGKQQSAIIGGKGSMVEVEKRTESLRDLIKETDDLEECKRIQERITRLSSGVVTIRVGGSSEVEIIEKKHRIEDALEAVKSAQLGGIHPGGGTTLLKAAKALKTPSLAEEQAIGYDIVKRSLVAPFEKICDNLDLESQVLASKVLKSKYGFGLDVKKKVIIDLYKAGIVDPVRVTTAAVRNSISVVSTLITTSNAIVEV